MNCHLANLEAANSYDANLPTPCPVSSTQPPSALTLSTTQKDIVALVAEQRLSAASGSSGNEPAPAVAADGSGTLSDHSSNHYSDDGDDESSVKKARIVITPVPETPVAPAAQKKTNEAAKLAAKEAQWIAKEDAATKKVADRKARAKDKKDKKLKKKDKKLKKKEDEKAAKVQAKQRGREAKEAAKAKKPKRGEDIVPNQLIDVPTSTLATTTVTEATGTKANTTGEDNKVNAQSKDPKVKGKGKGNADQPAATKRGAKTVVS